MRLKKGATPRKTEISSLLKQKNKGSKKNPALSDIVK